jgi:hypothetical protein
MWSVSPDDNGGESAWHFPCGLGAVISGLGQTEASGANIDASASPPTADLLLLEPLGWEVPLAAVLATMLASRPVCAPSSICESD